MNKKHVSKVGKYIGMACLLFVCAMVQSCRDEYYFDDREPSFLGASIYDELEKRGNFTYFLRVIDDLDYGLVLSQTGSKTLFVADDEAFMEAYADLEARLQKTLTDMQNDIVALQSFGVETPFCIHIYLSLSEFCLLGRDHDDTIGTTRTVKCI